MAEIASALMLLCFVTVGASMGLMMIYAHQIFLFSKEFSREMKEFGEMVRDFGKLMKQEADQIYPVLEAMNQLRAELSNQVNVTKVFRRQSQAAPPDNEEKEDYHAPWDS